MRDPKRIERLLNLIKKIWSQYPYLRLMQLLGNCSPTNMDSYFTEDTELEARLKDTYRIKKEDA